MLRIYDSLSEKKKNVRISQTHPLRLFVCGPTVYDYSHLGHARVYVFFDCFARYIRFRGSRLTYLQNITDIDDKIIERADSSHRPPLKLAREFERAYLNDMKSLYVTRVNHYARASDHVPRIISQIKRLVAKQYAYETSHGVYFEVRCFKNYGKLSKQNLDAVRPGWRIEPDDEKKDPLDFALWKKIDKPAFGFRSPWGWGRPGWHIEDTAISEKYLGSQYDIHGGGLDIKFPHHESEIAQQEASSGKRPFVKIWMHVGLLTVDGKKMSKSDRNFVTIQHFLTTYSPNVLRLIIAGSHYRSPIDYTNELAQQAQTTLLRIRSFITKLSLVKKIGIPNSLLQRQLAFYKREFISAMDDDLNTPQALAVIFKIINDYHDRWYLLNKKEARLVSHSLYEVFDVLGINLPILRIPASIKKCAQDREKLRRIEDFKAADSMRKRIEQAGFTIEDTPLGPIITPFTL